LSLVKKYCPPGLLGLALTALLASFMSGMAGNVTAFNTVWTYDLYQAYLAPNKSDEHYFGWAKFITVVGILLSIACAYFAKRCTTTPWTSSSLVFGFVNAPLFATFLLGMFWKRTTGTGAFLGLVGRHRRLGAVPRADHCRATMPGVKGGYLGVSQVPAKFPSEMAQNFWLASFAFTVCFVADAGHLAGDRAHQDRRGTEGPGLFAHAQNQGRGVPGVVFAPGVSRASCCSPAASS
jgi:SSS family solute:Na+ symporter